MWTCFILYIYFTFVLVQLGTAFFRPPINPHSQTSPRPPAASVPYCLLIALFVPCGSCNCCSWHGHEPSCAVFLPERQRARHYSRRGASRWWPSQSRFVSPGRFKARVLVWCDGFVLPDFSSDVDQNSKGKSPCLAPAVIIPSLLNGSVLLGSFSFSQGDLLGYFRDLMWCIIKVSFSKHI